MIKTQTLVPTTPSQILRADVPWYAGYTDKALAGIQLGKVVTVKVRSALGESHRSVRVNAEPITRVAYHASVDDSIFRRYEWLPFKFAFGTLVYDQNGDRLIYPRPEPIWVETHPAFATPQAAQPAAIVWREEEDGVKTSVAEFFIGEHGQDLDQFMAQVLATLPEPYSREQRLAMISRPLTVVVAAAPHQDVKDGLRELHDPLGRVCVHRAETVEQLMTLIGIADVVIIDNELPSTKAGVVVSTCGPFDLIRERRLYEMVGLIGAPMSIHRKWMTGELYGTGEYGYVLMHVDASCGGRMIYGDRGKYRHILDYVLDAAGLPVTKPAEPV